MAGPRSARTPVHRAARLLSASDGLNEWQRERALALEARVSDAAHLALELDAAEQRAEQMRAERDVAREDAAGAGVKHKEHMRTVLERVQRHNDAEMGKLKSERDELKAKLQTVTRARADARKQASDALDLATARRKQLEHAVARAAAADARARDWQERFQAVKDAIDVAHVTPQAHDRVSAGAATGGALTDPERAREAAMPPPRPRAVNEDPGTPEGAVSEVVTSVTAVVPFLPGACAGARAGRGAGGASRAPSMANAADSQPTAEARGGAGLTSSTSVAAQQETAKALLAMQASTPMQQTQAGHGAASSSVAMPARPRRGAGLPSHLRGYHLDLSGGPSTVMAPAQNGGGGAGSGQPGGQRIQIQAAAALAAAAPGPIPVDTVAEPEAAKVLMALTTAAGATAAGAQMDVRPRAQAVPHAAATLLKLPTNVRQVDAPAGDAAGAGAGGQPADLRRKSGRSSHRPKRFLDETLPEHHTYAQGCSKCRGSPAGCCHCNPSKRQRVAERDDAR